MINFMYMEQCIATATTKRSVANGQCRISRNIRTCALVVCLMYAPRIVISGGKQENLEGETFTFRVCFITCLNI